MSFTESSFNGGSFVSKDNFLKTDNKKTLEERVREQEQIAKRHKVKIPGEKNKTTLFDVLEAPRYAVTNSIYTMLKEHERDGLSFEDTGKILKSAMYGFSLKEKRNTKDLLKEYMPGKSELFYTAFGLAGDILTDPLTYVSFGSAGGAKGSADAVKLADNFVATQARRVANAVKGDAKGVLSDSARKFVERQGVSTWEQAVTKDLMSKFGGNNLQEALNRARRVKLKEYGDYGLRIKAPFQKNGIKIADGTAGDMLGGAMRKFGIDNKAVDVIENVPEYLGKLPGAKSIRKVFDTSYDYGAFKEGKDLERIYANERDLRLDKAFDNIRTVYSKLDNVGKDTIGNLNPNLQSLVNKAHGSHEKNKILFNAIRDMVDAGEGGKIFDRQMREVMLDTKSMLDEAWREIRKRNLTSKHAKLKNYFPRYFKNADGEIITEDAVKELAYLANKTSTKHTKIRKFATLQEARAEGLEPLDALDCLERYMRDVVKATNGHDLVKDMVHKYGKKIEVDEKDIFSKSFRKVKAKGFRDYVVPNEIANVIDRVNKVIVDPEETNALIKAFDKIQHVWKKQATIYNPGFHARNFYSNTFTGMMKDGFGKKQIENYKKAVDIFNKGAKGSDELVEITLQGVKKKVTYKEANDLLTKHGINTGFWKGSELDPVASISQQLKHKTIKKLDDVGSQAGSFVENTARIASALNDLDKGMTLKQATKRVNQYFFDYGDLTNTEKKIKRLIPFYTWMRKNVPQQLKLMVENPGKYTAFTSKPMRALDGFSDEEKKYLPEFMQGNYINPLGMTSADGNKIAWNPNLPFQDVGKINFNRPGKTLSDLALSGVTPLVKTPVELALNKSQFTEKPIAYDEYDKDVAPPAVELAVRAFPENVRMKLGIDQDEHGRIVMPAKWIYAITSLAPYISKGSNVRTAITGEGADWEKQKADPKMILSSLAGISSRPADMQYYKERYYGDRLKTLSRANNAEFKSQMDGLKRAGRLPEKTELKNFKKLKGF